jgi:hypothetical protein
LVQLCEKGTRQKVPLWYTPQDAGTPLHSALPIRTAVVVPVFSYEIQQEFLVIFYSLRIIPVRAGVWSMPLLQTHARPVRRRRVLASVVRACARVLCVCVCVCVRAYTR